MLIDQLKQDRITAMKTKQATRNTFLATLISEIQAVAKNDNNREVTDQDGIAVMEKFKKGANEMLKAQPSNAEAQQEIRWLNEYLPKQLSEEELRQAIKNIIAAYDDVNMGLVMKDLKAHFGGEYDGKLASQIVRELLT